MHSAFHCIQTKDYECEEVLKKIYCTLLFIAFKLCGWLKACQQYIVIALCFSLHSNQRRKQQQLHSLQIALCFSLHSNERFDATDKPLIRKLHSAFHCIQTQQAIELEQHQLHCTLLFIAFKQGGLLRSFSKRGEHTASERGMHLEC